jgi:hypothetical protein
MLLSPKVLSEEIKKTAAAAAREAHIQLGQDAINFLGKIPPPLDQSSSIDVDIPKLEKTIRSIVLSLPKPYVAARRAPRRGARSRRVQSIPISKAQLRRRLKGSQCHYLWFC